MKRALVLATLLVASLLSITAPAQAAVPVCQTPFATAGYPPGWTKLANKPEKFSQTDGNVIAQDLLYTAGGPYLVVGGNFTKITEWTGVPIAARNLAVMRVSDGHVVWSAKSMVGYVKTIQVKAGKIYVGGSFTQINGVARKAIAAFDANTFALSSWSPAVNGGTIRDIEVSDAGVAYLAGNGGVGAYRTSNATQVWYVPSSGGVVHTVLLTPGQTQLYVGGLFTHLGGFQQAYLASIYPVSSGAIFTQFTPNMRPRPAGDPSGELVLKLRWDLNGGQRRLIVGAGGSQTNSIQSIDSSFGGKYWSYNTEGDTQAVAVLGNTILSGQHRSHSNRTTGCPYAYYGNQWARDGFVLPWDPGLSGRPTLASYQSEANGGIADILVEPQTRKVFVVGDFSFYGQSCVDVDPVPCTGGSPLRGIARYWY